MDDNNMLVATLDILGVSALMQKATPKNVMSIASSIKQTFEAAEQSTRKFFEESHGLEFMEKFSSVLKATTTIYNFSDTMVIVCDLQNTTPENIKDALMAFFLQVRFATYEFLVSGYPIRGCIDIGYAYTSKDLIVGKPFVNALKISESLDFSGVVITPDAFSLFKLYKISNVAVVLPLEVPTKCGWKTHICMNWTIESSTTSECSIFSDAHDWQQYLYEKFCANGKQMTQSALRKLANTSNIVRAFILQNKVNQCKPNNETQLRRNYENQP